MRMKKIYMKIIIFRLIQIHCYDSTQWDSQRWWLILFCTGDIVHYAKNYNHEFVNTLQIKLKTTGTMKTICKNPIEVQTL